MHGLCAIYCPLPHNNMTVIIQAQAHLSIRQPILYKAIQMYHTANNFRYLSIYKGIKKFLNFKLTS